MVPWWGTVRADWPRESLGRVATINARVLPDSTPAEHEIEYIDIGSVDSIGRIGETERLSFATAPSRARRVPRAGDTILSTVRTYLRAVAFIREAAPSLVCSTGFAVVSPGDRLDPRFLFYWLRADPFVDEVCARSTGVSYPALNPSEIGHLPVPLPPLPTQRGIADFLDRKTAAIDALIEQKGRLLRLLDEKLQAIITQAVTKGLDPGVQLVDSGLPWFGDIPRHWQIAELRRLIAPGTSITYGIVQAGPHVEGGVPYIKTSDMGGDSLPKDGYSLTSHEIDESYRRSRVATGDLVVAIRATVGKALVVPPEVAGANLTQGTAKVSPGSVLYNEFLYFALNAPPAQQRFAALAKGATFKEITLDMLRRFPIPLPPGDEQREIAAFLAHAQRSLREQERLVRVTVASLKEYRQALISAAVTGKLDVTSASLEAA